MVSNSLENNKERGFAIKIWSYIVWILGLISGSFAFLMGIFLLTEKYQKNDLLVGISFSIIPLLLGIASLAFKIRNMAISIIIILLGVLGIIFSLLDYFIFR